MDKIGLFARELDGDFQKKINDFVRQILFLPLRDPWKMDHLKNYFYWTVE
jgi:hypothetical protein